MRLTPRCAFSMLCSMQRQRTCSLERLPLLHPDCDGSQRPHACKQLPKRSLDSVAWPSCCCLWCGMQAIISTIPPYKHSAAQQ